MEITASDTLARLGVRRGEDVRFQRVDHTRWEPGRVAGFGVDGSVLLHDLDGAARSLRPERVQVRRPGRRGRLQWRTLAEVAVTWEQLDLFGGAALDGRPLR